MITHPSNTNINKIRKWEKTELSRMIGEAVGDRVGKLLTIKGVFLRKGEFSRSTKSLFVLTIGLVLLIICLTAKINRDDSSHTTKRFDKFAHFTEDYYAPLNKISMDNHILGLMARYSNPNSTSDETAKVKSWASQICAKIYCCRDRRKKTILYMYHFRKAAGRLILSYLRYARHQIGGPLLFSTEGK